MKNFLSAFVVTTALSTTAFAGEFNQPSHDWRGNQPFVAKGQGIERLYLREKKEGGYFGQWNVHIDQDSTHHHYGDTYADDTYVGNQVNNTAVGSSSVTKVDVDGEGNSVKADASSKNTADTSADQKVTADHMDGDATDNSSGSNHVNDVAGDQIVEGYSHE